MRPSISEDRGIQHLTDQDLLIYSVGISTAGHAEMRMAQMNPQKHIIATTIDIDGAHATQQFFQNQQVDSKISIKIEDVAEPLPYEEATFDFIYARLVLHYLSKQRLDQALKELYRILKPQGRLFVVVRSTQCHTALTHNTNPKTGLTTFTAQQKAYSRYFHTEASISQHLQKAGFTLKSIDTYEEHLCDDFYRKEPSQFPEPLIEVVVSK